VPEFFEVVHRQRACRAFADDDVDDGLVRRVLDAATFAPSAENAQPWDFVVVRDRELRSRIGAITAALWRSGARAYEEGHLPSSLFHDVDAGAEGGIAAAPVMVVVCADLARGHERAMPSSVFPAVQNLLLAATALGLGSALTTLPAASADLAGLLGLPAHVKPYAVVPLGWPARPLGPPRRDPPRIRIL